MYVLYIRYPHNKLFWDFQFWFINKRKTRNYGVLLTSSRYAPPGYLYEVSGCLCGKINS